MVRFCLPEGQEEFLFRRSLIRSLITVSITLFSGFALYGADAKQTANQLIELARSGNPQLQNAIASTFDEKQLTAGTAWMGHGPDFFFATHAASQPTLFIDGVPGPTMQNLVKTDLWYAVARIKSVGELHSFYYLVTGNKFGGSLDLPAFAPSSYLQPGVPCGRRPSRPG